MPPIRKAVTVAASPDRVWAVLADFGGVARCARGKLAHIRACNAIGIAPADLQVVVKASRNGSSRRAAAL
jgi:hypothetical protein